MEAMVPIMAAALHNPHPLVKAIALKSTTRRTSVRKLRALRSSTISGAAEKSRNGKTAGWNANWHGGQGAPRVGAELRFQMKRGPAPIVRGVRGQAD